MPYDKKHRRLSKLALGTPKKNEDKGSSKYETSHIPKKRKIRGGVFG